MGQWGGWGGWGKRRTHAGYPQPGDHPEHMCVDGASAGHMLAIPSLETTLSKGPLSACKSCVPQRGTHVP